MSRRSGALPIRLVLVNLAVLAAGVTLVLGGFEWGLRRFHGRYDFFKVGVERPDFRQGPRNLPEIFTPDPDLGFRPILGEGRYYGPHGTLQNCYNLRKRPGVTRLLFIGDSVTHRGELIKALRARYGEERFEYWNAGVESYNTVQEVGFYLRYNRAIEPDHVILTMVVNDVETTPLVFVSEGKLVMVAPNLPRSAVNGWLFRRSLLYRQLVSWRVALQANRLRIKIRGEVVESLRELRDELQRENVRLSVLLLPLLAPPEAAPGAAATHRDLVGIAGGLGLRAFDLAEPVAEALRSMPAPDDQVHPGPEMASALAGYLQQRRLLD
jgi:hypothetical protein